MRYGPPAIDARPRSYDAAPHPPDDMRYGKFSKDGRQYIIERPDTPASWNNYLGTDEYCALVSNNAAGYSFYKSPKSGRILRF